MPSMPPIANRTCFVSSHRSSPPPLTPSPSPPPPPPPPPHPLPRPSPPPPPSSRFLISASHLFKRSFLPDRASSNAFLAASWGWDKVCGWAAEGIGGERETGRSAG
ncbi:unnamed protein product [Closterium sp. NIES-53]